MATLPRRGTLAGSRIKLLLLLKSTVAALEHFLVHAVEVGTILPPEPIAELWAPPLNLHCAIKAPLRGTAVPISPDVMEASTTVLAAPTVQRQAPLLRIPPLIKMALATPCVTSLHLSLVSLECKIEQMVGAPAILIVP